MCLRYCYLFQGETKDSGTAMWLIYYLNSYQFSWPNYYFCCYMVTFFQSFILEPGCCDSWEAWETYSFSTNRRQAEDIGGEGRSVTGRPDKVLLVYNTGFKCIKNSPDREGCCLEQLHGGDKTQFLLQHKLSVCRKFTVLVLFGHLLYSQGLACSRAQYISGDWMNAWFALCWHFISRMLEYFVEVIVKNILLYPLIGHPKCNSVWLWNSFNVYLNNPSQNPKLVVSD